MIGQVVIPSLKLIQIVLKLLSLHFNSPERFSLSSKGVNLAFQLLYALCCLLRLFSELLFGNCELCLFLNEMRISANQGLNLIVQLKTLSLIFRLVCCQFDGHGLNLQLRRLLHGLEIFRFFSSLLQKLLVVREGFIKSLVHVFPIGELRNCASLFFFDELLKGLIFVCGTNPLAPEFRLRGLQRRHFFL